MFILPPFSSADNMGTYRGLIDAIKGVMGYITRSKQKYVILSGSYTIYNRVFDDMIQYHIDTGADITMLYNQEEAEFFQGERFKDVRIRCV